MRGQDASLIPCSVPVFGGSFVAGASAGVVHHLGVIYFFTLGILNVYFARFLFFGQLVTVALKA